MAIDAPKAFKSFTGVWNIIIEDAIIATLFIVFPTLKVSGEISSNDMYETWLYKW